MDFEPYTDEDIRELIYSGIEYKMENPKTQLGRAIMLSLPNDIYDEVDSTEVDCFFKNRVKYLIQYLKKPRLLHKNLYYGTF